MAINKEHERSKANIIRSVICEYYNIHLDIINRKTAIRDIKEPRQIQMYFIKKYTKLILYDIAEYCNRDNHATIISSIKRINDLIDTELKFKNNINLLDKKIKNILDNYYPEISEEVDQEMLSIIC